MKGFLDITGILVPRQGIEATMQFLRQRGLQGLEAFFLWAGVRDESSLYRDAHDRSSPDRARY